VWAAAHSDGQDRQPQADSETRLDVIPWSVEVIAGDVALVIRALSPHAGLDEELRQAYNYNPRTRGHSLPYLDQMAVMPVLVATRSYYLDAFVLKHIGNQVNDRLVARCGDTRDTYEHSRYTGVVADGLDLDLGLRIDRHPPIIPQALRQLVGQPERILEQGVADDCATEVSACHIRI
jgi:hypothetical protein